MRASIAGFTFIELMVVMAIAGLLLVVSLTNFTKLLETQAYRGAVRDVVSAARATRAIRTNRPVDLAIDTQSRTHLFHQRDAGARAISHPARFC